MPRDINFSHFMLLKEEVGVYTNSSPAYLDPGAGVQHDVLDGALNVLRPRHQPSHLVVMTNLFPLPAWGRLRMLGVPVRSTLVFYHITTDFTCKFISVEKATLHSLAAVDDDVLGPDATLEHAHLRMVSTATEQARGLNAEVSDTFPVVVHNAEAILL